ncbi:HAD hydrolase-like protein [Microcoleus sp. bin38.metabat.b11b12b14.051]|uniref:HAD hydrolase-like protein n=1 Tax=Microcoleus sp. bin38.metabat.b11b12b14.051 TaxID=2742709 RepID=UPI0025E34C73|nr:HAD hydrolase-like protein [Microcoleus sp. bin38.metabat.b11b12b14.051]
MTKIFFFDLDGTLRQTKSGKTFINEPEDQQPIAGAEKAIIYYQSKGFVCIGITNQGGVAAGHKSLESAIAEQRITLSLFPQLSEIFFCPTWGESCCQVSRDNEPLPFSAPESGDSVISCRKPGHGMLLLASQSFGLDDAWMTGDRPEDKQAALTAGINFIPADVMLAKFTPGMTEIPCTHTDQNVLLKFLAL